MKKAAIDELRLALREQGQATRPALSAATGLSKVRVNQMVAQMVASGELIEGDLLRPMGGRPARLYRLAAEYAEHLLICITQDQGVYRVKLELLDALGGLKKTQERHYAHMETSSFSSILEPYEGRGLQSVILCLAVDLRFAGLRSLVRKRCTCPLRIEELATALAERKEGALSIAFEKGGVPRAHYHQAGQLRRAGDISLLPMPDTWESLDYGDHTLLEEMVARLVLFLSCALSPSHVILHADFWNERLMKRLRFNCESKLKSGRSLPLCFLPLSGAEAEERLRQLVLRP